MSTYYYPTIGGVEKVIQELAERYAAQGHHVSVFCSDSDKHSRIEKKYEVVNGVHVYRARTWVQLGLNSTIAPGTFWNLLWQKYDVVHSHVSQHDYVLVAGLISFLQKRPHVHTTHCPWTDKFRPWFLRFPLFFVEKIFNYPSFFFCSKIIAITPWEIKTLQRWTKEEKIEVIHNGMDQILFKKAKKNSFKKSLGVPLKDKLVLFFGRLHPTKSPHVLAEVAKQIVAERSNVSFAFVGPDEGEMERVKAIVKSEKKIHVTGAIHGKEKIAAMYQDSVMYVLPSYREGLPLTLFEAMASALPVVATPVNGVPYEMENNVHGYLVAHGDRVALKEKILYLLDHPEVAQAMGERNKEKVKGYTWDAIAKETMEVYESLIKEK